MTTNDEIEALSRMASDAVAMKRPPTQQTVRGWIRRLLAAGIAYGRGPENAARWEELMAVERAAQQFFRKMEERK